MSRRGSTIGDQPGSVDVAEATIWLKTLIPRCESKRTELDQLNFRQAHRNTKSSVHVDLQGEGVDQLFPPHSETNHLVYSLRFPAFPPHTVVKQNQLYVS